MSSGDALEIIGSYGARIDSAAQVILERNTYALYGMLRYFMGYADEKFQPSPHPVGKRIRPGLLLFIADGYGLVNEALPVALSIELFHNFTLIHDDVVDHDDLRRGRKTVWRIWGVDHAINSGDAQLLLALRALEGASTLSTSTLGVVRARLLDLYVEVIEGQYLDFTLAAALLSDPLVNEDAYLTMVQKKTAKLIRAATEIAPILSSQTEGDIRALGEYGENLGMAYQLYDDWQSIWGATEVTGKQVAGDVYERKKTLPVIYARDHLSHGDAARLKAFYENKPTALAVAEILTLFEKAGAKQALEKRASEYKKAAFDALSRASISPHIRTTLEDFARVLVPEVVSQSR